MFPAKDGFVTIAAHADQHFPILCRLIDRPEMATDPQERHGAGPPRQPGRDHRRRLGFTRQRTKQELLKHLGGQVPFSPVYNVRDIVADPHFAAREMLPWVPHPGLDHEVQIAGVAVKMTETPGKVRHRAPLLGEHTDEYLKSIGCSAADIDRLRAGKIVA